MTVERAPLAPREWIGADEYPWPAAGTLGEGDPIIACYCVVDAQSLLTKHQKPYLKLQLTDRHGPIEARVWEDAQRIESIAIPGAFVGVRGRVEIFNGMRQIRIERIDAVRVEIDDLDMFMPRSPRDPIVMARELDELIYSVQDRPLRALLLRMVGAESETGRAFRRAPAAKFNHHAYVGGLLEHTLSVTHLCDMVASHYGAEIDRDLLITGALLHDIGKIDEIGLEAGFPYTGRGKLLGHILMGLDRVATEGREVEGLAPDRLDLVLHLIASHQGKYEWQSPREPRILEAVLLHHADDMDAKMQLARDLTRRVESGWTEYSRNLGGEMLRHRSEEEARALRDAEGERDSAPYGAPPAAAARPERARPRSAGNPQADARAKRAQPPEREESAALTFDLFEE